MGRPKHEYLWKHATRPDSGKGFMCKYCQESYVGSITRLKWHLAKTEGHGINVCSHAPSDVQQEVLQTISARDSHGETSRKRKAVSSDPTRDTQMVVQQREVQNNEQILQEANQMENNNVPSTGEELPTREVVGDKFEEYVDQIWNWLMDGVLRIGIHGIGGVGKTELAKHINNKLLRLPNKFHYVYWVYVSPDCSTHKLQDSIAETLGLDISKVNDVNKRAARLSKAWAEKKKSLLILDDVWNYISLQDIGVLGNVIECSLIMTTRSLHLCGQISCVETVQVHPLLHNRTKEEEKEDWKLFIKELHVKTTLSEEVKEIAKSILNKYEGLPLGIITMARYMRGVVDIHRWKSALAGSIQRQTDLEIFQYLKSSYDHLKDTALQQCFLYCAILKEDELVGTVIEYLIDEGIIKGMKSRKEEFDEGYAMLKILQDVNLLDIHDTDDIGIFMRMHRLIKSMALEQGPRAIVENCKGLKQLPDEERWTEDLTRVSSTGNEIETIPSNYSPKCPNLSTLLLNDNRRLRSIGDSFFKELLGLKVLDLSRTLIETLPNSLLFPVNLTVLSLQGCPMLRRVPSLAILRGLKKLDLFGSRVEQVPEDIELLSKLMYLDLNGTPIEEIKEGILSKISHLRFLRLPYFVGIKKEEIASLKNLEALKCRFDNPLDFIAYFKALYERKLSEYYIIIGFDVYYDDYDHDFWGRDVKFRVAYLGCSIGEEWSASSKNEDLEALEIVKCEGAFTLSHFCQLNYATKLKRLLIYECNGIECLVSLSRQSSNVLESLEILALQHLKKFQVLFGIEGDVVLVPPALPEYGTCFSHLKRLDINNCPTIRKLFPPRLLPNLENLEELEVEDCSRLEEIIAAPEQEEEAGELYILPNLQTFDLRNLPQLHTICGGRMVCVSLKRIQVCKCQRLSKSNIPVFNTTTDENGKEPFEKVNIISDDTNEDDDDALSYAATDEDDDDALSYATTDEDDDDALSHTTTDEDDEHD